jgi:hypothetical protein
MQGARRLVIAFFAILVATSALAQTFSSEAGSIMVETVAPGLEPPWGLAFLPDGGMIVSERPGRMRIVSRVRGLQLSPGWRVRPGCYCSKVQSHVGGRVELHRTARVH